MERLSLHAKPTRWQSGTPREEKVYATLFPWVKNKWLTLGELVLTFVTGQQCYICCWVRNAPLPTASGLWLANHSLNWLLIGQVRLRNYFMQLDVDGIILSSSWAKTGDDTEYYAVHPPSSIHPLMLRLCSSDESWQVGQVQQSIYLLTLMSLCRAVTMKEFPGWLIQDSSVCTAPHTSHFVQICWNFLNSVYRFLSHCWNIEDRFLTLCFFNFERWAPSSLPCG